MSISMTSTAGEGLLLIHRKWEVLIKETTLPHTHRERERENQRRELTHSKCVWLMFEIALLLLLLLRSICLMTADLSPPTLVIHIFSNCGPPVKILLPVFLSFSFFFFNFHFKSAANEKRRKTQKLSMIKIYRFLLYLLTLLPCQIEMG